jgi:hypothetical protein
VRLHAPSLPGDIDLSLTLLDQIIIAALPANPLLQVTSTLPLFPICWIMA